MSDKIQKVAVLGAGVMGAQIAAHLANAGIPSLVFDISQEVAQKGVAVAGKIKPAAFYDRGAAKLMTPCNYEQHISRLKEVDWVIEVVVERLDIKQKVFRNILPHLTPGTIVTSNTSGISIKEMMDGMPESFRRNFLVTHFFNPPRYMHLLEIVPGENTDPAVTQKIAAFCENVLGKGIVYAKDTPNFVANRIGVYGMMMTLRVAEKMGLSVEAVDKLTGPVIGRPKSATLRTADVVGLDTLAHVSRTAYEKCLDDEEREIFDIPSYLKEMIERKWLGQKTKQGFYKKEGKEILSLDLKTLEYQPRQKVQFESLKQTRRMPATADRIHALAWAEDKAGKFVWEVIAKTLIYAANRIPEIADDIINVDNAMKWGFGWELGPFETWDILGVEKSVKRMKAEGKTVPAWVEKMIDAGIHSFYKMEQGKTEYYDPLRAKQVPAPEQPKVIRLAAEKQKRPVIEENANASLIDLGDGVLCVEFHSATAPTMNPLEPEMFDLIGLALKIIPEKGYTGLLLANEGQNFSAGANLGMILKLIMDRNWTQIEELSGSFQKLNQALRYAPFPVVSAPFNMCLGGGYEISGGVDRIVAAAELYLGLVEVGVGLIPGAGGTLRLLLNWIDRMKMRPMGPFPPVQKAFEVIAYARVSSSAAEAVKLGYLKMSDKIVINRDHLIYEGKQAVLELAEDYQPPQPREDILLPGEGGRLAIEATLDDMLKKGDISEHDRLIGSRLAYVLTGGERADVSRPVDENYLLDIERKAFVKLAKEPKTRDRIEYMLKTGKPLRN